jgi:hypothetical protein
MPARRSPTAPARRPGLVDLTSACGRNFTLRDVIECGETWAALAATQPTDNVPRQRASILGIARLCADVLDPLVDQFGRIELTYGFASPALTRHIRARIAPRLDQHAGCELGRTGRLVCGRRGQAVDLIVPGVPSHLVARWIAAETPFDRLYFYGRDRPLHVSVGPDDSRAVVWMRGVGEGRRVPFVIDARDLPTE